MFFGALRMLKLKKKFFKMMDAALDTVSLGILAEYGLQPPMIAVNTSEPFDKIPEINCVKGSVYEIYMLIRI